MMKRITLKIYLRKLLGAVLCLSILNISTLQIFAQEQMTQNQRKIKISKAESVEQTFARIVKFGRGAEFINTLKKDLSPNEIETALAWFDEEDASFFRAVYGEYERKAAEFEKQRLDSATEKPLAEPVKPAPKKRTNKRRAAFELSGGAFFRNASYQPFESDLNSGAAEEPQIETIVTEDGVKTVGGVENKIETADTIITKGSTGDVHRILNNQQNGSKYTQTSFEEIFNKKTRSRTRNEKKIHWTFLVAQCPDASGIVEGEAVFSVENKMTIANTTTIAVPAQILMLKAKLKGFVSDDAELTHYDMTGDLSETTTGFDRAKRLGMIDERSLSDGTRSFSVSVTGNKIAADAGSKSITGEINEGSSEHLSNSEHNRLVDFADEAIPMNLNNADNGFASSRTNWRLGFCVDVSLDAPKDKLKSGEQINVSAETVHKLDKTKINARLEATGSESVTPENQKAETSAQFTLTAPASEHFGGDITVRSVSRRGIATKTLTFGKEKPDEKPKKPVKNSPPKKCSGAWTGKITAVVRKRTERKRPPSGRLVRDLETRDETYNIDYFVLGIQDTSGGFANAFYADAQINYRDLQYSEKFYADGKTSCGGKIISTTETRKEEKLTTGDAKARLTVFITWTGEKGVFSFGSPELKAERVSSRIYETACPSYDRVNSEVNRSDGWIDVTSPSFDIEFDLGADSDKQLQGAKTIQKDDGTETLITWTLTRDCQ